jgi:hypothetical protein
MTTAQIYRQHVAMTIGRKLTTTEGRRVDELRRDGLNTEEIAARLTK